MAKTHKQQSIEACLGIINDPEASVWQRLDAVHCILILRGLEKPKTRNVAQEVLPSKPIEKTGAPSKTRKSDPAEAQTKLDELLHQVNAPKTLES